MKGLQNAILQKKLTDESIKELSKLKEMDRFIVIYDNFMDKLKIPYEAKYIWIYLSVKASDTGYLVLNIEELSQVLGFDFDATNRGLEILENNKGIFRFPAGNESEGTKAFELIIVSSYDHINMKFLPPENIKAINAENIKIFTYRELQDRSLNSYRELDNTDLRLKKIDGSVSNGVTLEKAVVKKDFQDTREYYWTNVEPLTNGLLNQRTEREIYHYITVLGKEIVYYAIDTACFNNAKSWNYIKSILNNWLNRGFKTIKDIEQYEQQRINLKNGINMNDSQSSILKFMENNIKEV